MAVFQVNNITERAKCKEKNVVPIFHPYLHTMLL